MIDNSRHLDCPICEQPSGLDRGTTLSDKCSVCGSRLHFDASQLVFGEPTLWLLSSLDAIPDERTRNINRPLLEKNDALALGLLNDRIVHGLTNPDRQILDEFAKNTPDKIIVVKLSIEFHERYKKLATESGHDCRIAR